MQRDMSRPVAPASPGVFSGRTPRRGYSSRPALPVTRCASAVPGAPRATAPSWSVSAASAVLTTIAVLAAVTALAELVVRLARVPAFVLPPPSAVLADLAHEPALFARSALVTVGEAAGGLAAGTAAAILFAISALHSRVLDRVLTPLVIASQTVPVIALAPLLILWLGYGLLPQIVICSLIAFFPLAVATLHGLRATDPSLLLLMASIGARRRDIFWRVRLPGAVPYLAAGLRTAVTLSLVGAVVAEWTGTDAGLGYLVLSANARMATGQAFAAVLVITLLGLVAYGAVAALEHRIRWWDSPSRRSWRTERKEQS